MRAIVTKLMDKGVVRTSRAPPIEGELQTRHDEQHRLVAQLAVSHQDPRLQTALLVHATLGEIGPKVMTIHGYERTDDGRIVAQVWECEIPRRR